MFRPLTGVGHYVKQLLSALARSSDAVEMRPFLSSLIRPPTSRHDQNGPIITGLPDRPNGNPSMNGWLRRILQRPYRAVFRLRAGGVDLYHEPNHIPIACDCPTVTTIHDLSVIVHPEWHPADRVEWYEREFAAGLQQTCRFIAASEYTRRDMIEHLGIAPDRIDVTYQAPRPAFHPQDAAIINALRAEIDIPAQFFLFVGTLEPRKNVVGLLEAYAALPAALRRDFPLVLAGGWGWKMEELPDILSALGVMDNVRLLGYLSDVALACLYSCCTALVWPTLYEGFGLPPLEAMACGATVIVSRVTSLPEVVGDGGVLLPPRDTQRWTEAMRRMAEDEAWRTACRQRGRAQASKFSWERCAAETLACYEAAVRVAV